MKRSTTRIAELLLLAAVLGLGWLAISPRPARKLPAAGAAAPVETRPIRAALDVRPAASAAPAQIASLFGWKAPAFAPEPGTPRLRPPEKPDWLSQLGYVVGSDGTPSYAFKDARSGAVFSLRPGQESRGWGLLEVRGNTFLLESAGQRYIVEGGARK